MRVTSEYYGRYQAPLDGGPLPLDGNMDLIKAVTNYFEVTDSTVTWTSSRPSPIISK